MNLREGGFYETERGRVVGPLTRMRHSVEETYYHDSFLEPGLWRANGRCIHPESKTGWSYGNITKETKKRSEDELLCLVE